MITVRPSRVPSPNRIETQTDKRPNAQSKSYTAPIAGIITNAPLATADLQSALILENFWPTPSGIEPRGGAQKRCTIVGAVGAFFEYRAGLTNTFFAASDAAIYSFSDTTPVDTALTAVVTGQTSSDYSFLEKQTDGGSFLTLVNGQDSALIFDGTTWQTVTDLSSPHAITGVDTDKLEHVWSYGNRTFFIEQGSMNAWYLGTNSVSGAAAVLPLAGVFNEGGNLLTGATWSADSGDGMDDRCVFATDQGEFAVYRGDPADANNWHLEGVYTLGKPLGKNAMMQVGGDLIIATKSGLVPISAATQKDPSQLKLHALTRNMDPDWRREIILAGNAGGWQIAKWDTRNMAVVAPPNSGAEQGYCFAANLETGAWTKFTGWQIDAMAVLGDGLYHGDNSGNIYLGDVGGFDDGNAFECKACFQFDHLDAPGYWKTAHAIKGTWRHQSAFAPKHTIAQDYRPNFGAAPSVPMSGTQEVGEWDASLWDQSDWAEDDRSWMVSEKWETASAQGETIAPQIQVTSAQAAKLRCELISVDVMYSTGGLAP